MKMHYLTHHVSDSAATTLADEQRHLYKCSQENCEYTTVNKTLLSVHMNSHSKESFKCSEKDCNYVGKSKLHLKR